MSDIRKSEQIEADLDSAREAVQVLRSQRGAAITAGQVDEVERLSGEIAKARDRIEALEDAVLAAQEVEADAERASAGMEVVKARKRLVERARAVRKLARAEDEAIDAVVEARLALRKGVSDLWNEADGPTRAIELDGLTDAINNLPMIANERLAHGFVLPSRVPLLDRSAPAPSIQEHLDIVLEAIAPGPGRPKKEAA